MKRFIAISMVCLLCSFGCSTIKADVAKVQADIKAVDWTAVAAWYDKAIGGLEQALNVAQAIDPGLAPEVLVAQPVVAAAKLAGDALTAAAGKYAVGNDHGGRCDIDGQDDRGAVRRGQKRRGPGGDKAGGPYYAGSDAGSGKVEYHFYDYADCPAPPSIFADFCPMTMEVDAEANAERQLKIGWTWRF